MQVPAVSAACIQDRLFWLIPTLHYLVDEVNVSLAYCLV